MHVHVHIAAGSPNVMQRFTTGPVVQMLAMHGVHFTVTNALHAALRARVPVIQVLVVVSCMTVLQVMSNCQCTDLVCTSGVSSFRYCFVHAG